MSNIAKALTFISNYLDQLEKNEIQAFGDFIYTKVFLIKNTTPPGTDLNKLFSTINSAGVQLEQTDIIKANLLKLIEEKVTYSKIWETCENMGNFFERNARVSFPQTNWDKINLENLIAFDKNVFKSEKDSTSDSNESSTNDSVSFDIESINLDTLSNYQIPERKNFNEDKRESTDVYCRSVISFGQLLIHTYRLHLNIEEGLKDFKGTFHVNRLIEIFKDLEDRKNPEEIRRFFHLLWKVRYLFDKYIIKWISDSNTKNESLELLNFNRNNESYYSRTKYEKSDSLMLQSVLYFTGDYLRQYWLTNYLSFLLNNHNNQKATDKNLLVKLEYLDNIFSTVTDKTDKELSWLLLQTNSNIEPSFDINTYLESNQGTSFKHYWFQKLEYLLWKNWNQPSDDKFNNFRITSKNSVEHIYPQNPENNHPVLEDNKLHSFGNLVLLSVSQNSEYSNKTVSVKKSMFLEKNDTYDSLKSFFIFKKDNWRENEITAHQNEMITLLLNHYNL